MPIILVEQTSSWVYVARPDAREDAVRWMPEIVALRADRIASITLLETGQAQQGLGGAPSGGIPTPTPAKTAKADKMAPGADQRVSVPKTPSP